MDKNQVYKLGLLAVLVLFWIHAAMNATHPSSWAHENMMIAIFIPLAVLATIYFKLSKTSCTLIAIFFMFHITGAQYTYSEVPLGYWIQNLFQMNRNMYDRLVHFSFGFLWTYPIREILLKTSRVKGFWSYYFPVDIVIASSALFEIFEWGYTRAMNPADSAAFMGLQGDMWDTPKDMLMAAIGSVVAMSLLLLIHLGISKRSRKEVSKSFKIKNGTPTFEEKEVPKFIKKSGKKSLKLARIATSKKIFPK